MPFPYKMQLKMLLVSSNQDILFVTLDSYRKCFANKKGLRVLQNLGVSEKEVKMMYMT